MFTYAIRRTVEVYITFIAVRVILVIPQAFCTCCRDILMFIFTFSTLFSSHQTIGAIALIVVIRILVLSTYWIPAKEIIANFKGTTMFATTSIRYFFLASRLTKFTMILVKDISRMLTLGNLSPITIPCADDFDLTIIMTINSSC